MRTRQRIVLDTNNLLQVISRRSKYHYVWQEFVKGEYDLCISNDILEEYEEILAQKMSPRVASILVELILRAPNTLRFDAHYRWRLIEQDPDDNKFVDCAIVANASYIVTEDAHFKVLATIPHPHVDVLRLHEFHHLLTRHLS